jgi:drug/metabolite transporter (DMT)-like permease
MWLALALGAALLQTAQFGVIKGRAREIPPMLLVLAAQIVGTVGWLAWVLLTRTPLVIPPVTWAWIGVATALAIAMNYLLWRASASGDISIVGPVLALSPVFAILPDWVLSGALPRGLGWVGVGLSVLGTMGLSGTPERRLDPVGLFARRDALDALGAAALLGVLSGVDRLNVHAIGLAPYLLALNAMMTVCTFALIALRTPGAFAAARQAGAVTTLLVNGALNTVGVALQLGALRLAPAAYVNAIRRTTALFSVVLGSVAFDEPGLGQRLGAAAVTVVGVVCLLLAR